MRLGKTDPAMDSDVRPVFLFQHYRRVFMTTRFAVLSMVLLLSRSSVLPAIDLNGDGTQEMGIFRPTDGLWAARNVSRCYYGTLGDIPMPGDYNGDGSDEIVVYRPTEGLWIPRGSTKFYFGTAGDLALSGNGGTLPGGTGKCSIALGDNVAAGGICSFAASLEGPQDWPAVASGEYSSAIGEGVIASGWGASARGHGLVYGYTEASGELSTAIGATARATGDYALAIGECATASGESSFARSGTAYGALASGAYSAAAGIGSQATGSYSTAIGEFVYATGRLSEARGDWESLTDPRRPTRADGDYSTAIGPGVQISGDYSTAIGSLVSVGSDYSLAVGSFIELTDSAEGSFMFGRGEESQWITVSAPNSAIFHGVNVGIDTVAPARKLHVNGVMRLQPLDDPPADPSEGDLYFNGIDHMLYCYASGDWRACFAPPL